MPQFILDRDGRLRYPAQIKQDGGKFVVAFRDFPHIRAEGKTADIAKAYALDALLYAFEECLYRGKRIPRASAQKQGEEIIEVPESASRRVRMLHDAG